MNPSEPSPRFAVIGGGISGLTAAYRLRQLVPPARVDVFEASDRLGGVLSTRREGDLLIERGADSFITKQPWALDLCNELGLAEEILPTNSENRRALVLRGDQLHPVPDGFVLIRPQRVTPILKSPLLSWRGRLRLLAERWRPRSLEIEASSYDESLSSFATNRLGREAFERIVEPLVAGIYTADATKLSVAATMPDAVQAVREHGTLWHRDKQTSEVSSGARYGSFVTLRGGMSVLVDQLASRLGSDTVHMNQNVTHVSRDADVWSIKSSTSDRHGPFDGIVFALPTPQAAELIEGIDLDLAGLLSKITYASSAIVTFAVPAEQIGRPLDAFGCVVPRIENRDIVAASFSHIKFAGRAPKGTALIRVFLGGALRSELVNKADNELTRIAFTELARVLQISGEWSPVEITRWREKMPQYHVGHVHLVDAIEERVRRVPGIALAGNGYRGVGIPFCVRSGDAAAKKIVADRQLN